MVSTMTKIFNVTIPQKDELWCTICKIVSSENNPMIYSIHCENILKCRQFLRETPEAMAAPITDQLLLEAGGSVYILVPKEDLEEDLFHSTFADRCDALGIQVIDLLDPIPSDVYEVCLHYTVEHKLAPQWIKVGEYLVEGRDFLGSTESAVKTAIKLNIEDIRDNSAQFHVKAVHLEIPFLNTARSSLQHDLQPPDDVYVLPSLKRAKVLNISKEIKEKHLFKDYEDLRAYWKNMHGYILPDYKEGLLFYDLEISFYNDLGHFKKSRFVYPETCLTSGPVKILFDPESSIRKFVHHLEGRMTKLCTQEFNVFPSTVNTHQAVEAAHTSRKSMSRAFDTCNIPTKRSRLSLPGINVSLTCKSKIDDESKPLAVNIELTVKKEKSDEQD